MNTRIRPRRLAALIAAVFVAAMLLTQFVSCGVSGELLASAELSGGRTAHAYGGIYGVRTVVVTDAEGEQICRLQVSGAISEPFTPDDGENYGFSVEDIDFDGIPDIRVMTVRSTAGNTYDCFRAAADGSFYRDEELSALRGARWNHETKEVAVCVRSHTDLPTEPDEPPRYIDSVSVTYYAAAEDGKFLQVREEALTYYSESEIYCFSVSLPDAEEEDGRTVTEERWILPDKLEREGLTDFGW